MGFLFFTGWNWLVQHKHIYHWISICFSDAFQTNLTVHALLFYYRKTCSSLNTLLVTLCLENKLILSLESSNPIFLSCELLLHFPLSETWNVSLVSSRKLAFSYHRKIISPFFFFLHYNKQKPSMTKLHIIFSCDIALTIVQLLSCVWLFLTPQTAAHWASLSFTISQSLLKLMSIESVMSSNHLVLFGLLCSLLCAYLYSWRALCDLSISPGQHQYFIPAGSQLMADDMTSKCFLKIFTDI